MLIFFSLCSALFAAAIFFIPKPRLGHTLVLLHTALMGVLAAYEYRHLGEWQYDFFKADHLGLLFLVLQVFINGLVAVHYIGYAQARQTSAKNIAIHNTGVILFNTAAVGVLLAAHVGALWAFMEATTLGSAILIYHDRHKHSIEATWKYLFVCSVAIAMAFAGILFLAVAVKETGHHELFFNKITELVPQMDSKWLQISFLLILTGFSVKVGLVPMFNVDIDAKDAAPSPVGAMLSSIMLNGGFVAIFRFYEVFAQSEIQAWMSNVLKLVALLSLFFAAIYMLRVGNLKRILAYSSMEHAAMAFLAFAFGGLGLQIAILHLSIHALVKTVLFLQVDQVHQIFGSKHDQDIGQYLRINPLGGLVLFLGLIAILALPPSGLFTTELMLFRHLAQAQQWWLLAAVMLMLLVLIYGMSHRLFPLLFSRNKTLEIHRQGIVYWESLLQLGVLLLVFWLGLVYPQPVQALVQAAAGQ
jgi:hydrogenase-4 component F